MSGQTTLVRRLSVPGDEAAVVALWGEALGASWPVASAALARRLREGTHLVAERGGELLGLAATQHDGGSRGAVTALLVAPRARGSGMGSRLLDEAVAALRGQGATEINLGGLPGPYFWPGVPTNLDGAQRFFERRGAAFTDLRTDMTLALAGYTTPPGVLERAAACGVGFALAAPADAAAVLAFEAEHFPRWLGSFRRALDGGRFEEVLLARDESGALVGTALIERTDARFVWQPLLPGAAEMGVVGVAEAARGRGIGLALSARGCELLAARGARQVYLAWVWSPGWYAQLGFRIWRVYLRGALTPAATGPGSGPAPAAR
jgi:ribosomal protein S18 acetylase RimI-like enzyme